jgi:hypothetical protein
MEERTVYVSYSRKDEIWRDRIVEGLRRGGLNADYILWDDRSIKYGDEWLNVINEALGAARVALLLVSPDYLASDFITSYEAPRLLELRESRGVLVIPIIVRPCNWMEVRWISRLLVAPRNGKPLSELNARQIARELKEVALVISEILARPAEPRLPDTARARSGVEALPRPTPPPELVEFCMANECVLYVGGGFSADVGLPLWKGFLTDLTEWAYERGYITDEAAQPYRAALAQDRLVAVSDGLTSELQEHPSALHKYLVSVYGRASKLSDRHRLLPRIPFSAALTTNLDNLVELTYKKSGAHFHVYTPQDGEALYGALNKQEFFILKLYGTLERAETVILAQTQYTDTIRENLPFAQFIESLFFSRTLLFVGVSLDGIDDYLRAISPVKIPNRRRHFALVAVSGNAWQAQAASLERRYGIVVLPFTASPDFAESRDFLQALADQVRPTGAAAVAAGLAGGERDVSGESYGGLKKVILQNIGPFENLELNLDSRWNILLGDNGVGKSNILKAIAVGLCGKDAQPFAGRLIKSGATNATIILQTERNIFKTEILRKNGEAELSSNPPRPLEVEGFLAIGFPPLRTVSWERPASYEGGEALGRSSAADILPLVRGEADPRLDRLKSWLLHLDHNIQSTSTAPELRARYQRLWQEFFRVVELVTPGVDLAPGRVDATARQVYVKTDDGQVPIEAVSQGTQSLMGWIGVVLQRLFEVYGSDVDPLQRYALVLMDEIDAHMHPQWQHTLIGKLKELFPRAQFLASSHSPLVVSGLAKEEILVFGRDEEDDRRVKVQRPPEDLKGWRIDQILTSLAFGLDGARDPETLRDLHRYTELAAEDEPSAPQELAALAAKLRLRLPNEGERAAARKAFELFQGYARSQLEAMPAAERKAVTDEIKLQIQEGITGSRRPS